MAKYGVANRKGAMHGMHGRHQLNTEPNPVGRPARKVAFGGVPRPKKRRY